MRLSHGLLAALVLGGVFLWPRHAEPERLTFEHVTPTYEVKSLYASMRGPEYTNADLALETGSPELLWIHGYEAMMVGDDGKTPKPQQFMCHNTLSIRRGLDQHRRLFGANPYGTRRLFTLSQGQYKVELPEGFAIPVVSTEKLMLQSQVLNLNESGVGEKVRHKVRAHYVRDSELRQSPRPLCIFPSGISVPVGDPQAAPVEQGDGCAVDAGGCPIEKDALTGKTRTPHWVVPPGRDERRTKVGHLFPFDTTIHYIAAHVHPYAVSFELRDLTENRTVWKAEGASLTANEGVGLDRISYFSSKEGLPVYRTHEYELVSVYDNKSKIDQTAMAFMFFYVEDKLFRKPTPETLASSDESFCGPVTDPAMLR